MPPIRRSRKPLLRPVRVGTILNDVIARQGLTAGFVLPRVQTAWVRAAGVVLARRSVPTSLRDGLLRVAVADSPYLQELSYLRAEILERLRAALPDVRLTTLRLHLRAGAASTIPEVPRPVTAPAPEPLLPPELARSLEEMERPLEGVQDPELRRAIRRAFIRNLVRG
jgi:hypothetical protein